ncbi:MAG: hypothetical protein VYD87_18105 [Pseudomonadota bacterium]|nr:hypothetical protein [Pseudomonadota bacterium]
MTGGTDHRRQTGSAARAALSPLMALGFLLGFGGDAGLDAAALPEGEGLLGAACPGPGAVELLLLPEDAARLDDAPEGGLTVTGAYTGLDKREGERPKPVGVFLRGGEVASRELARMDGLLIVDPDGAARIALASAAPMDGRRHDLTTLEGRAAFLSAAQAGGASVMQSHLLIRDGALDLRPVEDAPLAVRRVLFQARDGALGLWQSGGRALTLHAAAEELARDHAPVMALNLDMGGYDFCERAGRGAAACGLVDRAGMAKLSNLLRLRTAEDCP